VPVLETDRLILRGFSEKDVDDIYEYASNPIVTEFLPWEYHKTKEDTLRFLNYSKELFKSQENVDFVIELKSEKKVIGSISIRKWNDSNRCADIGYVL